MNITDRRPFTPDTALRLSKLFNMTPDYWLNLQTKLDLWKELHDNHALQALQTIQTLTL